MKKISVIVPVYKSEKYLKRCVDSIINQTYKNLEIILIDDGSPDNCGRICDDYKKVDERIRVIHKQNGGVSSARNAGLDIASGEYIGFVDSDDWINENMYECLINAVIKHEGDVVVCNYNYGRNVNIDTNEVFEYDGISACKKMFYEDRLYDGISAAPVDKLYRAELFDSIRFLESCHYAEDVLMCVQIFSVAGNVVKIDNSFYNYIRSENSAVLAEYSLKKTTEAEAYIEMLDSVKGKDKELENYLKHRCFEVIYYHYMQCRKLDNSAEKRKVISYLKSKIICVYKMLDRRSVKERVKLIIVLLLGIKE